MAGDAVSEMKLPPSYKEVREDTLDLQPQIHVLAGLDLDPKPQIKAIKLPAVVRFGSSLNDPAPAIRPASSARKVFIRGQHTWHLDPRQKKINKAVARALRMPLGKTVFTVKKPAPVVEPSGNETAHLENVQ